MSSDRVYLTKVSKGMDDERPYKSVTRRGCPLVSRRPHSSPVNNSVEGETTYRCSDHQCKEKVSSVENSLMSTEVKDMGKDQEREVRNSVVTKE